MTDKRDAPLWENSLLEFRNRIAAGTPTPGGGAVAAVAAALLQMVCVISVQRTPDVSMNAIAEKVKLCEEELARCTEEDVRVFDRYVAVRRSRSASAHADTQRWLLACTEVPLTAAKAVAKLEAYGAEMAPKTPDFLSSDLATARYFLEASRKALLANVNINLADLEEGGPKRAMLQRCEALQGKADSAC